MEINVPFSTLLELAQVTPVPSASSSLLQNLLEVKAGRGFGEPQTILCRQGLGMGVPHSPAIPWAEGAVSGKE